MSEVTINELEVSNTKPFTLIAGLNVLESDKVIDQVITSCIEATQKLNIPYVFKKPYTICFYSIFNFLIPWFHLIEVYHITYKT